MPTPVITNIDNVNKTYKADGVDYAINPATGRYAIASSIKPVPNSTIQNASQIKLPTPPVNTMSSAVNASNNELVSAQTSATNAESGFTNANTTLQSLTDQLMGKTADSQALEQTQGIPQLNQNLNELQNISRQKTLEYNTTPFSLEGQGRGISTGILRGQEAVKQRQLGYDIMLNNSNIQAQQGQLQLAQATVDRALALKYDPIIAKIESQKQILDNNKFMLSRADQKLAQAKSVALDAQMKKIEEQRANEKTINDLIIQASPVAPPDVLQRAKDIQAKGGSPVAVATALGVYGGDYLKNELLKAQIAKTKSEMVKVDTQTSNLKAQPTGVVTAPNGDAIGIPNETLSAIGRLKLNEGQANAVAFTSRMIQSAKAIDSQLGKIKGGFYETEGYDPTSVGSGFGRVVGSDQSRTYDINSKDFIRAKLRKESGATITDEEMSADAKIYTPSGMGLDEKDLKLSQTKRDEAIKSMIAQAGPAAPYLQQYYEQSKNQGDAFMSSNPQLNSWYNQTSTAVQTSSAQASTGGGTYGFSDNQK